MALPLSPGTWNIDKSHSAVEFSVRHLGLTNVRGRFDTFDGAVTVGDTLAERMQMFGYLETLLHARYPDLGLTFRDLGWSADELTLAVEDALLTEDSDVIRAVLAAAHARATAAEREIPAGQRLGPGGIPWTAAKMNLAA